MSDNNEIDIPEPINRPKNKSSVKVEHPSKVNVQPKAEVPAKVFGNKSRFEPEAIPVEIPSHGHPYRGVVEDEEVANGIIRIRPMTLAEEKILTTDRLIQQGKALDMILENCIKSNINPYDLISSDRLYLLFYLRGMSYGLNYEFSVKCYHCGTNFDQSIDIDKLPIKEWETPEEAAEPIVLTLPISKFIVEAHYMRGHDEAKLSELERKNRSFDDPDDSLGSAIIQLIVKVTTDDGEVLSPRDREDFINHMPAGDADYFRQTMRDNDCGIKMVDNIYCPNCNGELEFNVPLGRNFFRRNRR